MRFFEIENESNSLKKEIRKARYIFEKSFIDSASVGDVIKVFIFFLIEDFCKIFKKFLALLDLEPQIILEGYKESFSASPSLRNSGKKANSKFGYFFLILSVKPIGRVDLIITKFENFFC